MRTFVFLLTAGCVLSGCGNRGPLYLPTPATTSQQPGTLVTPPAGPDRPTPAETAPAPK